MIAIILVLFFGFTFLVIMAGAGLFWWSTQKNGNNGTNVDGNNNGGTNGGSGGTNGGSGDSGSGGSGTGGSGTGGSGTGGDGGCTSNADCSASERCVNGSCMPNNTDPTVVTNGSLIALKNAMGNRYLGLDEDNEPWLLDPSSDNWTSCNSLSPPCHYWFIVKVNQQTGQVITDINEQVNHGDVVRLYNLSTGNFIAPYSVSLLLRTPCGNSSKQVNPPCAYELKQSNVSSDRKLRYGESVSLQQYGDTNKNLLIMADTSHNARGLDMSNTHPEDGNWMVQATGDSNQQSQAYGILLDINDRLYSAPWG